jgi:uncharacterized membrane protein YhiD involved in acid resistance
MNIKKSLVVAGAVATVGVARLTGLGVASAATSSSGADDGTSSLVDKLVAKFNLNKSDVQAVFDADRTEHEAEMQQKMEERLDQAVTDGKITEDQKTKILAKIKEMKADMEANHDAMKGKTDDERRALMDQKRQEIQTWAEENDIPEEYLMFVGHVHGGPGGPKMMLKEDTSSSANEN